jgi:hypothetical protein
MRKTVVYLALIGVSATLWAEVPAGWKVVKSPTRLTRTASPTDTGGGGRCQVAVPGDWVVDAEADRMVGQTGHMKSPNDNASISIQEHAPGETLARAKEVDLLFNKDAKALEDSANRVWLTYRRAGTTYWTVLVAGNPVCDAGFILNDKSMEDTAKQIAMTVGSAK